MVSFAQRYVIGSTWLPQELESAMRIPLDVDRHSHYLSGQVQPRLIPNNLDVVVISGFEQIFSGTKNKPQQAHDFHGAYFKRGHPSTHQQLAQSITDYLKTQGIETAEAILLNQKTLNYRTLMHEGMHAVFHNLSAEDEARLIAASSGVRGKEYISMIVKASILPWELRFLIEDDKMQRMRVLYNFHGPKLFTGEANTTLQRTADELAKAIFSDLVYTDYDFLESEDKFRLTDEFIAGSFSDTTETERVCSSEIPAQLKTTLRSVGYKC